MCSGGEEVGGGGVGVRDLAKSTTSALRQPERVPVECEVCVWVVGVER